MHLQLRPGTDGALALAMANVIISEGLYDPRVRVASGPGGSRSSGRTRLSSRWSGPRRSPESRRPDPRGGPPLRHHQAGGDDAELRARGPPHQRRAESASGRRPGRSHRQLRHPRRQRVPAASWLEVGGAGFTTREHEFEMPRKWSDLPPRLGAERFPVWTEMVDQAQAMDLPRQVATGDPYPLARAGGLRPELPDVPGFGGLAGGRRQAGFHLRCRPVPDRQRQARRHRAARAAAPSSGASCAAIRRSTSSTRSRSSSRWVNPAPTPTSSIGLAQKLGLDYQS